MVGNGWEWCSTQWLEDYSEYEQKVDHALAGDAARVLRGGSFPFNRLGVRCACRSGLDPSGRSYDVGFRVVSPDL